VVKGKGKFIVIEGVDGSGKSTQAYLLSKYLGERKMRVLPTREPGGTPIGERVRDILLDPNGTPMIPECEMLLYMASRAQLAGEVLKPSLERGLHVVSERYIWSSLAYQGYAGGIAIESIEEIGRLATAGLEPDLTIILDVDPEIAFERDKIPAGLDQPAYDRIEKKGVEFQKKVREGFIEIARRNPEKIRVVDASRPPKVVFEDIKRLVSGVIG